MGLERRPTLCVAAHHLCLPLARGNYVTTPLPALCQPSYPYSRSRATIAAVERNTVASRSKASVPLFCEQMSPSLGWGSGECGGAWLSLRVSLLPPALRELGCSEKGPWGLCGCGCGMSGTSKYLYCLVWQRWGWCAGEQEWGGGLGCALVWQERRQA